MIRAWRLVTAKHADRIFAGIGAYRYGGRWNSPGRAVIYLSEHLSLCVLEATVHMIQRQMMSVFKYVWVDIPEELIAVLDPEDLPSDWNALPAPQSTKQLGDRWFDGRRLPVLKVPSTVVQVEHNFVVNPSHPDFHRLETGEVCDFRFNERLRKLKKS